jgi:hypothetical protein
MWDCILCGCRRIAASLRDCPKCRKGRDVATATTGGASNAKALPGETGYVPPEEPAVPGPAAAAEAPAVPDAAPEPQPDPEAAQPVSEPPAPEPAPEALPVASEPEPAPAPPLPARAGRFPQLREEE